MKTKVCYFIRWWMPAIAWMLVVFTASTDLMSADQTSRFIGAFLQWFIPQISPSAIAAIQLSVRKAAHLTEYAILAALLFRSLRGPNGSSISSATGALLGAAAYACFDELHQSFVSSRTGSAIDVMIDTTGAACGIAIYWILSERLARAAVDARTRPIK